MKDNVTKIDNAIDKIQKMNGYEFDWIPKSGIHENEGHDIGVIAQEVEKVIPEIVTTRDNGYKAVRYEKLVALLIEAIKDLQTEIISLKKQIPKPTLKTVKGKNTSEEKRKRFLSALEGPGSSSKQKPSMKVVKEQVPSEQDSAKVGQMAQQASDSGKIENIINRDKDSRAVGELANQKVEPRQTVQTGQKSLSNPSERPGVVPRTTLNHPKFRPVR